MITGVAAGDTYARLWAEAERSFQDGQVGIDPYLRDKSNDRRLGLSVIGRPGPVLNEQFVSFLERLKQVEPKQYYYRAAEFHLTILSLFTATEAFELHWNRLEDYRAPVDRALASGPAFTVHYRGITASRQAVMIQGFTQGQQLARLRARLRQALRAAGLGGGLDRRYAIETAHSTVFRFAAQPKELSRLWALLREYRTADFGRSRFHDLQLVKNDWYMSQEKAEILAHYPLVDSR